VSIVSAVKPWLIPASLTELLRADLAFRFDEHSGAFVPIMVSNISPCMHVSSPPPPPRVRVCACMYVCMCVCVLFLLVWFV
jgi:hypothetical protein